MLFSDQVIKDCVLGYYKEYRKKNNLKKDLIYFHDKVNTHIKDLVLFFSFSLCCFIFHEKLHFLCAILGKLPKSSPLGVV